MGLRYDAYPRAPPPDSGGGGGGSSVRPTRRRSRSNERALETALTASQRLSARATRADEDAALAAGQLALMAVYDAPSGAVETSSPGAHRAAVPYQDDADADPDDDDRASPFRSSPVDEKAPLVGPTGSAGAQADAD